MPPYYSAAPTSAERRSVPLHDKFMCRVCHLWKPNAQFSNKELNNFSQKCVNGTKPTAVSAKLRCRLCAGGAAAEVKCEGPCRETKALDEFSKNSRAAGGNKWCKECTLWKESQEDGVTVTAPPSAIMAPDEDGGFYQSSGPAPSWDPEVGGGEDEDYDYEFMGSSAPWQQPENNRIATTSTASIPKELTSYKSTLAAIGNLRLSGGPEYGSEYGSAAGAPPVVSSSTLDYLLPQVQGSSSSAVQPFNGEDSSHLESSATKSSASDAKQQSAVSDESADSEWTSVDARRRRAAPAANGVSYNAWDNTGRQHAQRRYPSSAGTTSRGSGSVTPSASTSSSATVRGQSRQVASSVSQSSGTSANGSALRSHSNWAKPVGSRTHQPQYQPKRANETPAHAVDDDSDSDYN